MTSNTRRRPGTNHSTSISTRSTLIWRQRRALPALVLLTGVFLAGILAFVGCEDDQGSKPKPVEHPFRGETVTLSVPQGLGFRDDWKLLLDEWSQQTGGAYRIVEYAAGAETDDKAASADLVVLPLTALGDYAANNRLSRIPAARLGNDASLKWLDIFSGL